MRRVLLAAVAALVFVPGAQGWTWPSDGSVLRPFVLGDDPYAGGQHRGVDIGGELGADVRAPASGSVSFAGTVPGGGKTITIQTADGYAVTLLQLGEILVAQRQVVEEGAFVARVGPSGDEITLDPHVHLGVRVTSDPNGYVDPLTLLPPREPSADAVEPAEAPVVVEGVAPAEPFEAAVPATPAVEELRAAEPAAEPVAGAGVPETPAVEPVAEQRAGPADAVTPAIAGRADEPAAEELAPEGSAAEKPGIGAVAESARSDPIARSGRSARAAGGLAPEQSAPPTPGFRPASGGLEPVARARSIRAAEPRSRSTRA